MEIRLRSVVRRKTETQTFGGFTWNFYYKIIFIRVNQPHPFDPCPLLQGKSMKPISRREFVQKTLAAGAAASFSSVLSGCGTSSRILGANDTVRVAVAGIRSKGSDHIEQFRKIPGVRVTALCDPDGDILGREASKFTARNEKVDSFTDIRKCLERKDVDALVVAAPNHWHSLMTVWACQAGKDVYVEKPVSHNIHEGRKAVEAARRYRRIVQAGTQARSDEALQEAISDIRGGSLGPMRIVRGFCYKRRESIGRVDGPQPIPPSVDYDLWTGPAPLEPLMRRELHYDWHWFWNTGCGDIGNQGCHELDMCRWAVGQNGLPARVFSIGGRFGYDDDGQTPNTLIAFFGYDPVPVVFEVRGLPRKTGDSAMDHFKGVRVGIVIECERGYFAGGAGGGWTYDGDGNKIRQYAGSGGDRHAVNFIEAVRSRNPAGLNADILGGHVSAALHHMANISHRLGNRLPFNEIEKSLGSETSAAFQGFENHLAENGVDPAQARAVRGASLEVGGDGNERDLFISRSAYDGGFWANRMLTRNYRPPFIVPENV
jgi:predicted dehydrogenase